ncbi:MAG: DNA-binding MarR family transcriptional regulator [Crocinitomix sp.]|jgi:DNA-binding MarR family transcriptional regulator
MISKSELTYFKFIGLSHQVEDCIKNALKTCDITHPQLNVLYILNEQHPKAMSVKALKSKMIVNQPDITRLIDRLVNKGLVLRETCLENRRMVDLALTAEGRLVFEQAHLAGKKATGNFFGDFLTESESGELYDLMNKVKLKR